MKARIRGRGFSPLTQFHARLPHWLKRSTQYHSHRQASGDGLRELVPNWWKSAFAASPCTESLPRRMNCLPTATASGSRWLYLEACQADPEQSRLHFMAGICEWNIGQHAAAGAHLREAVRLEPNQPMTHHGLADWFVDTGDFAGALRHSARAMELAPNDPHFAVSRAAILEACGKREEAWSLARQLLNTPFRSARLAAVFARLAPGTGQEQAALDLIGEQTNSPATTAGEHRMVRLAAAGLLDRVGHYDNAFAFAQSGHSCEPGAYDPGDIERMVQRQIDYFTPAKLHDLPRASHGNRRPVFIIGMPRSGTSLVEQILASHPHVYGAGELTAIDDISTNLCGSDWTTGAYPQCLDALPGKNCTDKYAADYLRVINALDQNATFVTDKMPTNFLDLGIISTLFPDAHVIHCTRNALDTCVSCYFTHFAIGHLHTRNLSHLGAYYRSYRRLMEHWTKKLNFPMLEVRYEAVVADVATEARRMLDFMGLLWDDRCTAFHMTGRQVTTASRNQVNQPIYSTSVNRWRNYDKHLGPLREALGEWAKA